MAKILFGVMGDARGHVNRAKILAREMLMHEFLFLGGGKVADLKAEKYPVVTIPMLSTLYSAHKVNIPATLLNGVRVISGWRGILRNVEKIIKRFKPDIVLSDYEVFTPIAARRLGLPCISIDHQHFLTKCRFKAPQGQLLSRLMLNLSIRLLYSHAGYYLITSFFHLPPINPADSEIVPPLLRPDIQEIQPENRDHVLVYQTSPTFYRFLSVLEKMPCRFTIYGLDPRPTTKNIIFKAPSTSEFLADLSSCRYAITNGSHNVICEALFLEKPVLAFPIHRAYEQFFNGYMLREMGYGDYSLASRPDMELFEDFEKKLDYFQNRISSADLSGNEKVVQRVNDLIKAMVPLQG